MDEALRQIANMLTDMWERTADESSRLAIEDACESLTELM